MSDIIAARHVLVARLSLSRARSLARARVRVRNLDMCNSDSSIAVRWAVARTVDARWCVRTLRCHGRTVYVGPARAADAPTSSTANAHGAQSVEGATREVPSCPNNTMHVYIRDNQRAHTWACVRACAQVSRTCAMPSPHCVYISSLLHTLCDVCREHTRTRV